MTLTADEKQQFDADLSVYLRLQDSYMPYKVPRRLAMDVVACNGRGLSYERADERAELAYCQGCKMCPRYAQDALQSSKQKACDPFGFIHKVSKVLIYSVLRSSITIR